LRNSPLAPHKPHYHLLAPAAAATGGGIRAAPPGQPMKVDLV
jgi:hypothetical protein